MVFLQQFHFQNSYRNFELVPIERKWWGCYFILQLVSVQFPLYCLFKNFFSLKEISNRRYYWNLREKVGKKAMVSILNFLSILFLCLSNFEQLWCCNSDYDIVLSYVTRRKMLIQEHLEISMPMKISTSKLPYNC